MFGNYDEKQQDRPSTHGHDFGVECPFLADFCLSRRGRSRPIAAPDDRQKLAMSINYLSKMAAPLSAAGKHLEQMFPKGGLTRIRAGGQQALMAIG
jgi:hypothetical protein